MTDDNQNTGSQTPSEKELFIGAEGSGANAKPFNGVNKEAPLENEIDYGDLGEEQRLRYMKWLEFCRQLGIEGNVEPKSILGIQTWGYKDDKAIVVLAGNLGALIDEGNKVSFEGDILTEEAVDSLALQILAHDWDGINLKGNAQQKAMLAEAIYRIDPTANIINAPKGIRPEPVAPEQSTPETLEPEQNVAPKQNTVKEKPTIEEVESKHSRQKIEKRPDGVIVPSGDTHIYAGDVLNKEFKGMEGRLSEIARSSKDKETKRHANELLEKVYKDMELGDYLKNKKKYSTALNGLHEGLLANGGNDAEIKTVLSGANETLDKLRGKKPLVIEQFADVPKSKKTGLGPKGDDAGKRAGSQYNQMKN